MSTTTAPRLRFDLPPGFAGLPLGDTTAQTAETARDLTSRLIVHSGQSAARVTEGLGVLAAIMAPNHVRLFGRFAVGPPHAPAFASLALAALPLSLADKETGRIATELLRLYRERHPHAEARVAALPIGPALVAVNAGRYRFPGKVHPEYKVELQVPAGDHLVIMVVTTNSERGWPAVAAAAMRVATSLAVDREG